MISPSEPVKDGVRRRRKADVPETLTTPISIFQRAARDLGTYIVDSVFDAFHEAAERKWLANRLRSK